MPLFHFSKLPTIYIQKRERLNPMKTNSYPADVRADMKAIEAYLTATHGEISPEWQTTLRLIADNLHLYRQCREAIDKHGIFNPTTGRKSPLLSTVKDLNSTLLKLLSEVGATPYAQGRIKTPDTETTQDFIGSLLNE